MSDSPTPEANKLRFESYNGMSRPAMFMGIPIMPMVGLMMGALIFGAGGTALFSWVWGIVLAMPFFAALIGLRLMCLIDPQYLRRVRFALRRFRFNLTYGKALLLTPFNPKWSQYYGQRSARQRYADGGKDTASEIPR